MRQKLFSLLRWAAVLLIFLFLGKKVVSDWQAVQQYEWKINYFWLVFSLLILFGNFVYLSWVWSEILKIFGKTLRLKKAFKISYLSNLARYLPGRIWQYISLVAMCEREGISKSTSTASFVLSQLINIPAALLLILATGVLPAVTRQDWIKDAIWILGGAVTLGALVVITQPKLTEKTLRWLLRKVEKTEPAVALKKTSLAGIFASYVFGWFLHGTAFFFFTVAVTGEVENFFPVVGAYVAAYLIGYLSFFTPGGLGVREAVLALI
ncbi:MAG: flippase-like domain-containing protein, partial [candidate division Zixibacteria bacterium]|nr:flippase-like domain-containing protein [candidate division Zixibacteria bacterium]